MAQHPGNGQIALQRAEAGVGAADAAEHQLGEQQIKGAVGVPVDVAWARLVVVPAVTEGTAPEVDDVAPPPHVAA